MHRHAALLPYGFALLITIGACNTLDEQHPPRQTTQTSTATRQAVTAPAPTPAPTAEPAPVGQQVTVSRVVDGDTFELTDGRKVRVLGIDSCEMNTYGGEQAKSGAEANLMNIYNQPITLTAEPGVDLDRYGRLLRYVTMKGGYDFGEHMVKNDHTGIYQGKPNDASPRYLQRLYAADLQYAANPPAGRNCDDPYPTIGNSNDNSNDGGGRNHRDGALTGGYCGHKWWC